HSRDRGRPDRSDPRDLMSTAAGLTGDIVIVGGYGHVGRAIAGHLAPRYPNRVVLAGRSEATALETAAETGSGCRGIRLDTASGEAPEGAGTVIMCMDQFDPSF